MGLSYIREIHNYLVHLPPAIGCIVLDAVAKYGQTICVNEI